jgi:CheY-like chemotaxis protein
MRASSVTGPVPGPHILIADDSADMRLYVEGCLHAIGPVRVMQAADGRAALHLARATPPALVIAERTLPGLSGRMLCRALHADPRTHGIPVLLISDEAPSAAAIGDGFLAKPFNAAGLQAEVERLLGRPLAPHTLLP